MNKCIIVSLFFFVCSPSDICVIHFVYPYTKWMCFFCSGALQLFHKALLSSSPPYFMSSYVSPGLYHTHIHFQPTFSLTSLPPALSQPTHVHPFTTHRHTHTHTINICTHLFTSFLFFLPVSVCQRSYSFHSNR